MSRIKGLPSGLDEMLWPNRLTLQVLGLWPYDQSNFARLRLRISAISLIFLVVPQLYSINYYWGDITYLAETGNLAVPFALFLFKHLYVITHHDKFTRVLKWIEQLWNITDDPEERANYEDLARIGKSVSIVALSACLANFFAIVSMAVFADIKFHYRNNDTRHRRLLPVDIVYGFFDYENTPTYECLFVSQMISMLVGVSVGVASDGSILTVILHIIGQFKLINYRLRTIGNKYNTGFYHANNNSNIKKDISNCIKHHQLAVRVANSVCELISPIAFGQLLTSGFQICISCYAIIEGSARGFVLAKCSAILFSVIVQLMMWCVPGDFLDQESGAVATSIFYELPWTSLPMSLKRDLIFVIFRAQKTCKVTAFYQVTNIAKLTEAFKASGSYMALLRSFKP